MFPVTATIWLNNILVTLQGASHIFMDELELASSSPMKRWFAEGIELKCSSAN